MFVIRPITNHDAEAFVKIAFETGIGITSLPKERKALLQKLAHAEQSFQTKVAQPGDQFYLFVLEDTATGNVGGTSGIIAKTGLKTPLYFYRCESLPAKGKEKGLKDIPIMRVASYVKAPSEICSLYLSPHLRKTGLGRLLSLARFLFMACFPERFDKIIFAEMRGYIEKNLFSPFWEGIGRHFLDIDFPTLLHLKDENSLNMADILPAYPVYISLLPQEVQMAIGKVHDHTLPALNMLLREGFKLTEEIDVFDGGPKIETEIKDIYTIRRSQVDTLAEIASQPFASPTHLLCNHSLDFRACFAYIQRAQSRGICITREVAEALKLQVGDTVCYTALS